jgi:Protein of unknown function (DUF2726)
MANSFLDQLAVMTVLLFFAMVAGIYMERWRAKKVSAEWRAKNAGDSRFYNKNRVVPIKAPADEAAPTTDAAAQLKTVMAAEFKPRVILNRKESRVFAAVERTIDDLGGGWRLMAQVSLGEILWSDDKSAYWAINSKRVDMLIVDLKGMPLHAIEYQGSGHHIGGEAAARDAVKKEALRRAGIGYIEVSEGDTAAELRMKLARLSAQALVIQNKPAVAGHK